MRAREMKEHKERGEGGGGAKRERDRDREKKKERHADREGMKYLDRPYNMHNPLKETVLYNN